MLLRRDALAPGSALAEAQETTQAIAKCSYRLKVGFAQ